MTGMRFGLLTVVSRAENHKKQTVWTCLCECGQSVYVQGGHLRNGKILSCGCYRKENSRKKATIHGRHNTKLYKVWLSARQRCRNPNNSDYPHYGGRGITFSSEWDDFKVFEAWALCHGYAEGLTIERIDVNKGYEPDNCTWITKAEQMRNTTRTLNNRKD